MSLGTLQRALFCYLFYAMLLPYLLLYLCLSTDQQAV